MERDYRFENLLIAKSLVAAYSNIPECVKEAYENEEFETLDSAFVDYLDRELNDSLESYTKGLVEGGMSVEDSVKVKKELYRKAVKLQMLMDFDNV